MTSEIANEDRQYEDCPPRPDAMAFSLRAFGYDLAMAIADLVDNSIFAGASNVWISYAWNDGAPWVRVLDDGSGMNHDDLITAMTLGSRNPLERREPKDLGRFGLGLKTASFSQCKKVTVYTKTEGKTAELRYWDLDYLNETRKWKIGCVADSNMLPLVVELDSLKCGTLVLWQKLDRMTVDLSDTDVEQSFLNAFLEVKNYIEMVFHRYLNDSFKKLNIYVGKGVCMPWDPFLISNSFTQELSSERYENSKISVIPYVLPHVSKRDDNENTSGAGPKGWNAQQGFYVYRNRRMIVSGGYLNLGLLPEEHYKLARIKLDITNDMDHEWSIDVRKAVASPPENLKGELLRIARATRTRAAEVYRARSGRAKRFANDGKRNVWIRKQMGDKVVYRLNRDNPALKKILDEAEMNQKWISKLFYVIEQTLPHRLILMDGMEHEDSQIGLPEDISKPTDDMLQLCTYFYESERRKGKSHEVAADVVCSQEPFDSSPLFRAFLDKLEGG